MEENRNKVNRSNSGNTPLKLIYQDGDFKKRLKTLTEREASYFSIMRPQHGVLYIQAKPGVGKSAVARSIADKLGLYYIDIRLSMADETDMQFPNLTLHKELDIHVIEHAIPEWAVMANERPTLIHFEEINRASLPVRNAALQILLDRAIGPRFKFNKNVYMLSSGNLGDEDGTDVEEFDTALNNRLIHRKHDMPAPEWLQWADGNIHPDICKFIEYYPENIYIRPSENVQEFASPRSWHFLSDFIISNFGGGPKFDEHGSVMKDETGEILHFYEGYKVDNRGQIVTVNVADSSKTELTSDDNRVVGVREYGEQKDYIRELSSVISNYVGPVASSSFIRFLEERTRVTLKDIIDNFRKVENDLKKFKRDKYSELLSEAKNTNITKWSDTNIDNFAQFLKMCSADERIGFFLYIIDHGNATHVNTISDPKVRILLKKFKEELRNIKSINQNNRK